MKKKLLLLLPFLALSLTGCPNFFDVDDIEIKKKEVDFVCNRGFKRYYIQSALDLPTPEKVEQEQNSLLRIGDNFQKMIIVGGMTPTHMNDNGIVIMNIYDFLLNDNGLGME